MDTTQTELTADTLTAKHIIDLLAEAQADNDVLTADLCTIALKGRDSDGTGTTLGLPCTVVSARTTIADVINNNRV